ncbi:MAG: methyltransferase domain-containing protein [Zoogloeaceae bacterium]|jgi:SAM-dependent methyltransferase|nr:methyltransferase domain-containing protein [Zoogloeaceae bacterium]
MDSRVSRNDCIPVVSDGLEQLALEEIARRVRLNTPPRVLDMPCGEGSRAVAMARLGADVLAVDVPPLEGSVRGRALVAGVADHVRFFSTLKIGVALLEALPEGVFDLVFCHYGIHPLPYGEAAQTLRGLLKRLRIGGKLFVSAYGLHSDLGEAYADADKPVAERYCRLTPARARSYNLPGSVCLYTERDLVNLLIHIGGGVLRTFTSTHGAVKGIAVRI